MINKDMYDSKLKKNTLYNAIKIGITLVFPLITFMYISRILHAENVGKINFGNSVISYISLIATLGVQTYAIRECSKVRDDREALERTAGEIFSINLLSTILAYLILILLLIFAKPLANYRLLICIQSVTVLCTTLGADWINTVFEDFRYITIRTLVIQLVSLVLMFIFVKDESDYLIYASIAVFASSGGYIFNIIYRERFCKIRFRIRMNAKQHMQPIVMLFSLILAQKIYVNSDLTIIGLFRGDKEVGLYTAATNIYFITNMVVASVSTIVLPSLSRAFKTHNYEEVNKNIRFAVGFIIMLGVPAVIMILTLAEHIIGAISGKEYVEAAGTLRILVLALIMSFVGGVIGNLTMIPAGRERVCLNSTVLSAISNVVLNILFVGRYGMIIAGVTTFISELINVVYLFPKIDKKIKVDNILLLIKGPITGGFFMVIICLLCRNIMQNSYLIFLISFLVSFFIYALTLYMNRNEIFMSFVGDKIEKYIRRKVQ